MSITYHEPASAGNASGLPKSGNRRRERHQSDFDASALTPGGRVIFSRTRRPVSTCNLLASLAGLGREARHG